MPSKSRAEQRLMGAAEHGATFPKAQKLRATMSHQQLHDFASGSEASKPARVLHPTMVARAAAVKAAHAHLSATVPGFKQLPSREQIRRTHLQTLKAR